MDVRTLTRTELKTVYDRYMRDDFPPMELRPYGSMKKLLQAGQYLPYGYYAEDTLQAYACFYASAPYLLLDLFAVVPEKRDQGVGSAFLNALPPYLPSNRGTFLETESPDTAPSPEEKALRERRIAFYLRSGAVRTTLRCLLFHVDYEILFLPGDGELQTDEALLAGLQTLYRSLYGGVFGRLCRPYRTES